MMRTADQLRRVYRDVTNEYDAWLTSQSARLAKKWRGELAADGGAEGAIFEGWSWRFLRQHVTDIQIGESAPTGGTDFLCMQGADRFHAECTCIPLDTMRQHYRCDDIWSEPPTTRIVGSFVRSIQNKVIAKQKQVSKNHGLPTLLLIGTFHFTASTAFDAGLAGDVLISHTCYRVDISADPVVLNSGYLATDLRRAAFTKLADNGQAVLPVRQVISGLLLCGAGTAPKCQFDDQAPDVVGILNHTARVKFDRCLLPHIPFFKLDLELQPGHACVVAV